MTNATPSMLTPELFEPKQAYDLAADYYDSWIWQKFWRNNEFRVALHLLRNFEGITSTLDVGAGTGFYLKKLNDDNKFAVGVDVSLRMLQRARAHLGSEVPVIVGDVTALPLGNQRFDFILGMRVLSHVRDLGLACAEIGRVLRRHGTVLMSDLDIEHNYTETHLPAGDRKLRVRTYKRSTHEVFEAAQQSGGLALQVVHRLDAHNVLLGTAESRPRTLDFTGERAIGYVALLRRS